MEGERLTTTDRTLVPNRFVVHLHPTDMAEFGDMTGTLASELADGALAFARAHHYTLVDRPRVDLLADADDRARRHPGGRPVRRPDRGPRGGPVAGTGHARRRGDDGAVDPTHTRVFQVPRPTTPRAVLRVTDPDGGDPRGRHRGGGLTIGRATDNDCVAPRRAGLAPSRPDQRPPRDARLRGPREHQRVARQRRRASPRSCSASATGSRWGTRRWSSRSPGRPTDGRLPARPVGRPAPLPRPPLPVPVPGRPRPAARPAGGRPGADRATRPAGRARVAER